MKTEDIDRVLKDLKELDGKVKDNPPKGAIGLLIAELKEYRVTAEKEETISDIARATNRFLTDNESNPLNAKEIEDRIYEGKLSNVVYTIANCLGSVARNNRPFGTDDLFELKDALVEIAYLMSLEEKSK